VNFKLDHYRLRRIGGVRHLKTAEDLFGTPQGGPGTDAAVAAAVQWAERIMRKIDGVFQSGS
jgi:hypothetical protein